MSDPHALSNQHLRRRLLERRELSRGCNLVVSLIIAITRFVAALRTAWHEPAFRSLAGLTLLLLVLGTLVFHEVEGWAYLDSLYFSAITLATVGYGDFTHKTAAGKLLTVFYVFMGFGLLAALLTRFADALIQSEREGRERRRKRRMRVRTKQARRAAEAAPTNASDEPQARAGE